MAMRLKKGSEIGKKKIETYESLRQSKNKKIAKENARSYRLVKLKKEGYNISNGYRLLIDNPFTGNPKNMTKKEASDSLKKLKSGDYYVGNTNFITYAKGLKKVKEE